MPFIAITLKEPAPVLDLERMTREISAAAGIGPERLNLVVNTYSADRYYRGSGSKSPVIHITIRRHNGPEVIQSLMRAAAGAVSAQTGTEASKVTVCVSLMDDGYFLSGGTIQ